MFLFNFFLFLNPYLQFIMIFHILYLFIFLFIYLYVLKKHTHKFDFIFMQHLEKYII